MRTRSASRKQSRLRVDENKTTKKAYTTNRLKRRALPIEKDQSKLDGHECTTKAPPAKKKKTENTKHGGDVEMTRQQNETKETDELEIQEPKETDEEQNDEVSESISKRIEELSKSWEKVTEKVKELEKQSTQSTADITSKIESLRNSIKRLQARQTKFFKDVQSENKKLRKEIAKLKDQNNTIEAKFEELEKHMKHIALGQLVTVFEKNLAEFVLPQDVTLGIFGCVSYMKQWLGKNEKNTEGKERKDVLDKLLKQVNWKDENWNILKEIKNTRNLSAHPKVCLEKAKTAIANFVPHWEKQLFVMINAFEKINCLMVLGRFSSNFKKIIDCSWKNGPIYRSTWKNGKLNKIRWETLLEEKEWTKYHRKVLGEMAKLNRRDSILHAIDFDEAKKHVVGYITLDFEQQCFDIIDVMKKIPPEVWIEERIVDKDFYEKNKQ